MKKTPSLSPTLIWLLCFAVWILWGYLLNSKSEVIEETFHARSESRQSGYSFINPLLDCEVEWKWENQKYIPFEKEVTEKIKKTIMEKNPWIHLSVYFRNLNNGPWFWINENEPFSPASLLKLPILISYYKWKESKPNLFEERIPVTTETFWIAQNIAPKNPLKPGEVRTVGELLEHMIWYSDNLASTSLVTFIPEEIVNNSFKDFWVTSPSEGATTTTDFVSVKEYASFFRILYNSSYLNRDSSEKALKLLSQVDYEDGLKKYIPKNVVVSHKFWERGGELNGKIVNQLHDCGIVYYSQYPYLICVMTKWETTFPKLQTLIQNTSKIIFDEIAEKYPEK